VAKIKMTVGFLFSNEKVLLVKKEKPNWQKGYWNGIGGKLLPDEAPLAGMRREFHEETALDVPDARWHLVGMEGQAEYETYFYSAFEPMGATLPPVPRLNDANEWLAWRELRFLDQLQVIGNLRWLIPLALDWRRPVFHAHADAHIRGRATW
jgi:8-oxo-dGTP diphosphatase